MIFSNGRALRRLPGVTVPRIVASTSGVWPLRRFITRYPEPCGKKLPNPMIKLCDINPTAKEKLPPNFPDKSGVGVHYIDAFVAPMNAALPDNIRVSCKRRGLKVSLRVGTKKGEGLMRRLQ